MTVDRVGETHQVPRPNFLSDAYCKLFLGFPCSNANCFRASNFIGCTIRMLIQHIETDLDISSQVCLFGL